MARTLQLPVLALLLAPFAALLAAEQPTAVQFTENFSDAAAVKRDWRGLDKTLTDGDPTKRFWSIDDGALRGQAFGDIHPSGIFHQISGKDVRLSLRFKMPVGTLVAICFNGDNPVIDMKNFHLAGFHIRTDKIVAWDETNLVPKGSPEAAELKKKGTPNRKFIYAKQEKITLTPDVWHDLVVEMHGKEIIGLIDGKQVITYTTNAGNEPKLTVQLSIGGQKGKDLAGWFDDVKVETLAAK